MLDKTFDPKSIEPSIAKQWAKTIGQPSDEGEPYCIMVPPPNVTGSLHLGHALQHSIMDTLCRHKRSQGYQVLLQAGTDHAGIATQMVVEKQLKEKNIDKYTLGRSQFIDKVWAWKEHSGGTINTQMKRMGLSVDWATERFTLDPEFQKVVTQTFIALHKKGFVYRKKRLVYWDTVLKTAVSDLEVQTEPRQGSMWSIRYPLKNGNYIIVATTRPETLFGDMAICVHPEDERYQHLIGQQAIIPISGRQIPIIADETVEPDFGTGCLKITPAHDFTDFDIGQRHQLECMNILMPDGTLNELCPEEFQGLDRFDARKKVIQTLKQLDLLDTIQPHTAPLPVGDRSQSVLEPYLTDQWYIKMQDLASAALSDYHAGNLQFVPSNYGNVYQQWLDNIQDWCISRQLWWGHQIPAYYDENGQVYVGEDEDSVRQAHDIKGPLTRDEDVLDTWFSSALWPFVTLGWPNTTDRLDHFYPNQLLITGFDIIFFWVARMTMLGKYFTQTMPFPTVYITGLIRDEMGQKMSKSKGNVLDPLDLINGCSLDELIKKRTYGMMLPRLKEAVTQSTTKSFPQGIEAHGTDALRFTLLSMSTHSKDINFDLNKLRAHRNFCNKIWNASRFLSQSNQTASIDNVFTQALDAQLQLLMQDTQRYLDEYRFDLYAKTIYDFFWHEFCDWHIELSKVNANETSSDRMGHLYQMFDQILIIMHPALPFITEALWQGKYGESTSITTQRLPKVKKASQEALNTLKSLQLLIGGIRNIRSELNISPKEPLQLFYTYDNDHLLTQFKAEVQQLAGIDRIDSVSHMPEHCCVFIHKDIEIGIDITGKINPVEEKNRLSKKIEKLHKQLQKLLQKTDNPNYQNKAPKALKDNDAILLQGFKADIQRLEEHLKLISKL